MLKQSMLSLLLISGFNLMPVVAHAAPGAVEVKSVAEVEVDVKTPAGKVEKKREAVKLATPGTTVIYTTQFKNISAKPAGNIVIVNPIPQNTAYVAGSAFGPNSDISFSVDGGKQFAAAEKLITKTKEGRERPALASDYTDIRWTYKGDLAPGKTGEAGFRAVIK